ncbi:MAG: M50 family metallopeptidase [Actinobacteria bacterium]|nr:M50 family metallopeptidase [Actinomycetota bacterium]
MRTSMAQLLPIAVALALVWSRRPWRLLRPIVTIAHEGGHVLTALLAGRRLAGVRLHADASGLTVSRGRSGGPGMVVMLLAGYLTPCLLGLAAAVLVDADQHQLILAVSVAALAALLVTVRNVFGLVVIVLTGAALVAAGFTAPAWVQRASAAVLAWFLLFGGLRSIGDLRRSRRRTRTRASDADQLARLTRVPAAVWIGVFVLAAGGAIVAAAALLVAA